jgi:hypothetical protein
MPPGMSLQQTFNEKTNFLPLMTLIQPIDSDKPKTLCNTARHSRNQRGEFGGEFFSAPGEKYFYNGGVENRTSSAMTQTFVAFISLGPSPFKRHDKNQSYQQIRSFQRKITNSLIPY